MDRLETLQALADANRLGIVDALAWGDRAPGELIDELALPSNLLAHHLSVLESAEVVQRHRSEGDGRKSYVRLRLDNPIVAVTVAAHTLAPVPRVVFVCTHNSARSQMAAGIFAQLSSVPVGSAGTRPAQAIHPLAARTMAAHRVGAEGHPPAHLADVIAEGDLVIAVCDNAYEDDQTGVRAAAHWSVPDPSRVNTPEAFEAAFAQLTPRVQHLAASLNRESTS